MTVAFLRIYIDVKEKWYIAVLGKNLERKEGRLCAAESEAEKRGMLESRPFLVGRKQKSQNCVKMELIIIYFF
jgi:hypothetical protein